MSRLLTLHDPAEARAYYAAGLWRDETFYALLARHAAARPDAKALRDSARHLSWRELKDWVDAIADAFHEAGVRTGERVALWASNRAEVVAAFLACSRQGYVCNPSLHRNYTLEEICGLLGRTRAAAILVEDGWGADSDRHDAVATVAGLPGMRRVFRIPAVRQSGDLPAPGTRPRNLRGPDPNPDSVCYLAFTSGTTGRPKGVMHSGQHPAGELPGSREGLASRRIDCPPDPVAAQPSHRLGGGRAVAGRRHAARDRRSGAPVARASTG